MNIAKKTGSPLVRVDAKNWLRRNGESYKILQEKKITNDEEFNIKHQLDGEKTFTKDLYNMYAQKAANKLYNGGNNLIITSSSGFKSSDENGDRNVVFILYIMAR